MKNKLVMIWLLSYPLNLFGQKEENINSNIKISSINVVLDSDNRTSNHFQPNKLRPYYSFFNATTGSNDFFMISDNSLKYSTSSLLSRNQFSPYKVDSFNPYGAKNLESGIVVGVINLLLNKIQ